MNLTRKSFECQYPKPGKDLHVLVPGHAAECFSNAARLDGTLESPLPMGLNMSMYQRFDESNLCFIPEYLVLSAEFDVPAVDEAGDEEGDEEEARKQDPQHQPELTVHALKREHPFIQNS